MTKAWLPGDVLNSSDFILTGDNNYLLQNNLKLQLIANGENEI